MDVISFLPAWRWRTVFFDGGVEKLVVLPTVLRILQRRIGFRNDLEFFLTVGIFGNIRMQSASKLPVRLLDIRSRCSVFDAEVLIIVPIFHRIRTPKLKLE